MLAISLKFPAKRFHATPWGRQVNEGAVEWPPSPWRLLRSLVAVWHHKLPDVSEEEMRQLVEKLTAAPRYCLPSASQGHTRHYMPLVNGDRTKVFDTFIGVSPEDAVIAVWPDVDLSDSQRELLGQLLNAMTYFGRAESWVEGELLDEAPYEANAEPYELGSPAPAGRELVRTLMAVPAAEHATWFAETRAEHRRRKLDELVAAAQAKGKPVDKVKLSSKDEQAVDKALPPTLFDALHADTAELRNAGWNQPPGSRWINYARPIDAFSPQAHRRKRDRRSHIKPTVARFAVCGSVRPLLTEAVIIGERIRTKLMGCSRHVRLDENAAPVFSGKHADGSPLSAGHEHAHYLCEAAGVDGRISHVTVFAPSGFDADDERAFARLAAGGVWGSDGYDMQLVLLGIGYPDDFGGFAEKAGQSKLLAKSQVWQSRTPFVLSRHISKKRLPTLESIAENPSLHQALVDELRFELQQRSHLRPYSETVEIEPILKPKHAGTLLGGHFTTWLKFRRQRLAGGGSRPGSNGFGFRLVFAEPVTGPIALGYGSHFGLGLFVAAAGDGQS